MALQSSGIDHLAVACSRDDVGKKKSGADAPSPQVKAAAEKLYRLAKDQGLTIEELSKKARKPFQTFNNWKNGHTTAKIESMEAYASVLGATVVLSIKAPGEGDDGGLHVDNRDTFMIARLVDGMDDEDREWWRKQIQDFVQWRRLNPPDPLPALPAPRGRGRT